MRADLLKYITNLQQEAAPAAAAAKEHTENTRTTYELDAEVGTLSNTTNTGKWQLWSSNNIRYLGSREVP